MKFGSSAWTRGAYPLCCATEARPCAEAPAAAISGDTREGLTDGAAAGAARAELDKAGAHRRGTHRTSVRFGHACAGCFAPTAATVTGRPSRAFAAGAKRRTVVRARLALDNERQGRRLCDRRGDEADAIVRDRVAPDAQFVQPLWRPLIGRQYIELHAKVSFRKRAQHETVCTAGRPSPPELPLTTCCVPQIPPEVE